MKLPSKVVILGSSGFIGKALFDHLLGIIGGQGLFGYSSSMVDLTVPGSLDTVRDIVDPETVLVVVSAVTPERVKSDTLDNLQTNIRMIVNLARYLEDHPPAKCVYLSTAAVYSSQNNDTAINESTTVAPDSYYGAAKFAGECILQNIGNRGSFPVLVLRPCRISGPGDLHTNYGPGKFVRSILEDRTLHLFGDGSELRDHLFVNDFLELFCCLTFNEFSGVYNLATGHSRPYSEMIDHLRHIVPFDFEVCHLPRTRPTVDQGFDIAKLAAATPDYKYTELRQGMQETYEAFAGAPFAGR